jgi:hypothetical protein
MDNDALKQSILTLQTNLRAANAQSGVDYGIKSKLTQEHELGKLLVDQYIKELKLVRQVGSVCRLYAWGSYCVCSVWN